MKELAFIIAVVWWLVPASAQDTLKEMTLPDVHITAFHQGFVGESVDSLFWSQRITTDLDATVLFRIARDLSVMHGILEIDESDIGSIEIGQKVSLCIES
ncbi:MAG: hypothetical protein ACK54P_01895, partial [Bacteroidota bacterium]